MGKKIKKKKMKKQIYQQGWVCPKCGSVWAVWVDRCKNCSQHYQYDLPTWASGT